jgi:hypothetical protein
MAFPRPQPGMYRAMLGTEDDRVHWGTFEEPKTKVIQEFIFDRLEQEHDQEFRDGILTTTLSAIAATPSYAGYEVASWLDSIDPDVDDEGIEAALDIAEKTDQQESNVPAFFALAVNSCLNETDGIVIDGGLYPEIVMERDLLLLPEIAKKRETLKLLSEKLNEIGIEVRPVLAEILGKIVLESKRMPLSRVKQVEAAVQSCMDQQYKRLYQRLFTIGTEIRIGFVTGREVFKLLLDYTFRKKRRKYSRWSTHSAKFAGIRAKRATTYFDLLREESVSAVKKRDAASQKQPARPNEAKKSKRLVINGQEIKETVVPSVQHNVLDQNEEPEAPESDEGEASSPGDTTKKQRAQKKPAVKKSIYGLRTRSKAKEVT